jgi:hypothetical protein
MIGLAAVVLLIAIASAIIGSAVREGPIRTAGGAQADVVANMTVENEADGADEPLAELGIAPSADNAQVAARP